MISIHFFLSSSPYPAWFFFPWEKSAHVLEVKKRKLVIGDADDARKKGFQESCVAIFKCHDLHFYRNHKWILPWRREAKWTTSCENLRIPLHRLPTVMTVVGKRSEADESQTECNLLVARAESERRTSKWMRMGICVFMRKTKFNEFESLKQFKDFPYFFPSSSSLYAVVHFAAFTLWWLYI